MSRATIRKVFVTGLVVWVVGGVFLLLSVRGGMASNSPLYPAGVILAGMGALLDVFAWLMAVVSSAVFGRWGWFGVLLVLGVVGLLPLVMIVYSVAGPTQRRASPRRRLAT